jgi:hypothetical protein
VATDGFDIARLQDGVRFEDNDQPLGTEDLPVPATVEVEGL